MAQTSQPWEGITVGDATRAPYSADEWDDMFEALFNSGGTSYEDFGVVGGYLNALEVTGAASPVTIDTGAALVHGKWYLNNVAETLVVPAPAALDRWDYVVLQCDWTGVGAHGVPQTTRIALHQGIEGAGVPPTPTRTDGTLWEIPLASLFVVAPGGAITVYDARRFLSSHPHDYFWSAGDFSAVNAGGVTPPAWVNNGDYLHWAFDAALLDGVARHWWVPPTAMAVIPTVELYWTGTVTAAGDVVWVVQLSSHACDSDLPTAALYHAWRDTVTPVTADLLRCSLLPATGGNPADLGLWWERYAVNHFIRMLVYRDGAAGADTYGSDAGLVGLRIRCA